MKHAEVTVNTGGALEPFKMSIPLSGHRLFDNSIVMVPQIFLNNKIYLNREKVSELHRDGPHDGTG